MIRHEDTSPRGLNKAFEYLSSFGYESCMLTYHSRENDMFIKLARAIDPTIPMNYIIAMRTYAISPEYLGLMINGFSEIAQDKLIFNIVAGDLHSNETSVEDVVDNCMIQTSQDRVKYTKLWLEKFTNLEILKNKIPPLYMSGTSDLTFKNCELFNGGIMTMVDFYLENKEKLQKYNPRMVGIQILIRNTDEEADYIKHKYYDGDKLKWCYFYSEETLTKKIKELEDNGVTDIMITGLPFWENKNSLHPDPEIERVHKFVKKMSGF
jgi:hypothetical protein